MGKHPLKFINKKTKLFSMNVVLVSLLFTLSIYLPRWTQPNHLFKVSNGNTRTVYEICSNLTIKPPERCRRLRSGVFIVNFEQVLYIVLVFPLLTLINSMLPGKEVWYWLCEVFGDFVYLCFTNVFNFRIGSIFHLVVDFLLIFCFRYRIVKINQKVVWVVVDGTSICRWKCKSSLF